MTNSAEIKDRELVAQKASDNSVEIMSIVAKAAADSTVDVVKLEKLMDLQERILNRNSKNAFAADFVRMRPHLPKVLRTKDNTQTKSKYAPLEDINTSVDPVLEKYGFSTATKIIAQTETSVTVRAELWHRDGHTETTEITMPLDRTGIAGSVNKTGPHALSSSVTYGKRVAICALLNISTGDDKDGNLVAEVQLITIEQAANIDSRALAIGEDYRKRFLEWAKVKAANEIPATNYKKVIGALDAKEKETKEAKKTVKS